MAGQWDRNDATPWCNHTEVPKIGANWPRAAGQLLQRSWATGRTGL